MELQIKKLSECCLSISDGDHQPPPKQATGVPFITISNINQMNEISFDEVMYVSDEYYDGLADIKRAQEGDILYSVVGSFGIPVLIKNNNRFVFQRHIAILRPNREIVLPEYLYYVMLNSDFYRIADKYAIGAAQRTISLDSLRNIEVKIHPIEEQKRIVSKLVCIDTKIRNNVAINDNLLQLATDIYDFWFAQFNYPNHQNLPYKSSGGAMYLNNYLNRQVSAEISDISVGDITICHDSKRIPLSSNERLKMQGNIPYYGATGIMDYIDTHIFEGDYLLLAEDGSVMTSQGTPILQWIHGKTWVNNHAHVLEPVEGYSCLLLYMLLKDIPVVQIKTGSIQYKINQDNLNNYHVLNIPEYLRKLYIEKTSSIEQKILELRTENQGLIHLRDWLLPMLMNGQATIDD